MECHETVKSIESDTRKINCVRWVGEKKEAKPPTYVCLPEHKQTICIQDKH